MGEFTKNTIITIVTRVTQLFLGIGTSIIVARMLGPESKGIFAVATLLTSMIVIFSDFGIGSASVFYIGKEKYSPKRVFGANVIFSTLISTIATLVGLVVITYFGDRLFPGIDHRYMYFALPLITLNVFANSVINVLLGMQKIKKYSLNQLLQTGLVFLLSGLFLAVFKLGIYAAISAQMVSLFVVNIMLMIATIKETRGIEFYFKKDIIKDFLSYSSRIYLTNIVSFIHLRIDFFLLNLLINPAAVGVYSIAANLAEMVWIIPKSVATVLFPKVAGEKDAKRLKEFTPMVTRTLILITLVSALGLLLISRPGIKLLYGEEFLGAVLPFYFLIIGTVFMSGSRTITNDLAGRGRLNEHLFANIFSVVVNIAVNLIMIPKYGIVGAGIATCTSYTATFFLRAYLYCKISGNKFSDLVVPKKSDFIFYKKTARSFWVRLKSLKRSAA